MAWKDNSVRTKIATEREKCFSSLYKPFDMRNQMSPSNCVEQGSMCLVYMRKKETNE